MAINLYNPFHENYEALCERTVGRHSQLTTGRAALLRVQKGERPLPLYLFGPPGCGKSHLLAIFSKELRKETPWVLLSDELPVLGSVERIIKRILKVLPEKRGVVFFEGLGRQLQGLTLNERRSFRRLLTDELQGLYLIGSGERIGVELSGREEAFYNHFIPMSVPALSDIEQEQLLEEVIEEVDGVGERSLQCRKLLRRSLGGVPRLTIALGEAINSTPKAPVSFFLREILHRSAASYHYRFHSLPPQGQLLFEQLALSAVELSPSELAERLSYSSAHTSTVLRRLHRERLVTSRRSGRSSWYSVTDDLFRFWFEYRKPTWSETRIAQILDSLEGMREIMFEADLEELLQQETIKGARLYREIEMLRHERLTQPDTVTYNVG